MSALLPLQAHNIALNHFPPQIIESAALPWGPLPADLRNVYRHPDVVLAADCVYFEPAFPLLLETLSALLGSEDRQTVCYFCMKKRRKADMRFVKESRKKFEVVEVKEEVVLEDKGVFL